MKKIKKILSYTVFWIIQCTWGIIMTFIGAVAALGLIITGHKPKLLGPNVYFEVGESWGGVSFGPFFICCRNSDLATKYHECGHSIQNMIWGPLMPFVVCIPSAARYWLYCLDNPVKRALFVAGIMVAAILLTASGACIFAMIGGFKAIVIAFEVIRLYFLSLVIWLNAFQLPQFYNDNYPDYDKIWFESQATRWGAKIYGKKED